MQELFTDTKRTGKPQEKGRIIILTCQIGKTPYIAKAYARACRGKDYTSLGIKTAPLACHLSHI